MTTTTDTASLLAKMLEQTKRFETVIIKDHEAQRLVAAFEAERQCRIAAEARVKELEQQKPCAAISKIKHWREAPCNGVDWAKGWKEGWNACIKKIEAAGGIVVGDSS